MATVLVAPDSFKGTLSATEIAAALGRGIEAAGGRADLLPGADGGEGTAAALGARERRAPAHDPRGRPIEAAYGELPDGRAVVEVAAASGLPLLAPAECDPERASSAGTGELILAALRAGASEVLVAAGGSATVDGGAGALAALAAGGGLRGARLTVLCDVTVPWEAAARAFGPQKGAGPAGVERLSARLEAMARSLPHDPRGVPGTGAAGGLAGGLWAHGARLVPGAAFVLDAAGWQERVARAPLVVTGEGRLDQTTRAGKLVAEVALRAGAAGVPCDAVCGTDALGPAGARALGLRRVIEAGDPAALAAAGAQLAA